MSRKKSRKMPERVRKVVSFVKEDLWSIDLKGLGFMKRLGVQTLRFLSIVQKGFGANRCALHAAGLTYFSILTVVPVLLLMLLLTKPCGMYEWSREKLRVKTDEAITTFFEKEKAAPAASTAAEPGAESPAEEPKKAESPAGELAAAPQPPVAPPPPDAAPSASAPDATASAPSAPPATSTGSEFGKQARELRDRILSQIDEKIASFNFGLMAIVGFLVLAWTVIKTFGQVEASINEIWNVAKDRPIWRKAYLYVSAVMVLPLLSVLAMSLPLLRMVKDVLDATLGAAACTKWMGDALASLLDSSSFSFFISLLFSAMAITFLFKAMPNRKVNTRAAFRGGLVTALLLGLWVRACAELQFGIANSSAAYGSFALVPILIVWINMSWTIILLGSNMAYAFQCIHSGVRALPRE